MEFQDRRDAGRILARYLQSLHEWPGAIVLGLPRGGVPVAYEVARKLGLPLDILIVRKLGVPGREELAMGALASGGTVVINQSVVDELSISPEVIDMIIAGEKLEIERREREYRGSRPPARIEGRTVLLIDDGLATGASMRAAVRALRPKARQVVVAVPVAAASTCRELRSEVEQVVCLATPKPFFAVGLAYRDFDQTTDDEVRTLLAQAFHDNGASAA